MIAGIDGLSTSAERRRGYELAHERRGLVPDPALVVHGDSTAEGARKATLALRDLPRPPTALFSAVQLLLRRMHDPDLPARTVRITAEIAHRESCGCSPRHQHVG